MIDFACPKCGGPLSVSDDLVRKKGLCPFCAQLVKVPPKGIGGWLLLAALALISGVVSMLVVLFLWASLISSVIRDVLEGEVLSPALGSVLIGEFMLTVALFCLLCYATLIFFRKKAHAPKAILCFLIANVVLNIVHWFCFGVLLGFDSSLDMQRFDALHAAVTLLLGWGGYFLYSRRVEVTFVNP